ncbi:FmdB family zinc ribbon protein [Glaciibacter sp. 2TAF33]|uniref:FmdB family zinc ribbon protein n=1 Tax=Glaciibacter sp. 2TAF33 TaxID=3233015 RepID=UPI003F8F5364
MPTYSYRCTECDTAFDIHQAFSDNSLTDCPTCGGKLRKVFSSIGVTFNGSGFYRNDSRSTTSSTDKAATAPAAKTTAPSTSVAKASTSTGAVASAAS